MEDPFISICIPTYKRVHNLKRLLISIFAQTYSNYEIIITDDSPDDSVSELLISFPESIKIKYFKNNIAAGTPENWNIAISQAAGEWIKLMHDDDWFSRPDALQVFADKTKTSNNDFIFSACNNIYASGKEVNEFLSGWRKEMLEDNCLNLFYLNVIGHPSTVMHRRDNELIYDAGYKWVVDIDFYIRYLQKHSGFDYIPDMLVNIGTDETQISSVLYKNPAVEVPEYLSMLAKFKPDLLIRHEYVFHCVWNLVKRFQIRNIEQIRIFGYHGQLPDHLQAIINFQKPIPRIIIKQTNWSKILMKKCFTKITDGLNN